jgi:hypothetical protein
MANAGEHEDDHFGANTVRHDLGEGHTRCGMSDRLRRRLEETA